MRTSALFDAKTSDFSKFVICPYGQGGLSQCEHFADKGGEGISISRFSADVFDRRPLMNML